MSELAHSHDPALPNLGARLRQMRADRGITLAELSALAQISVAMLSHIERGQTSPSLKSLERLRIALGVPLAAFFLPQDGAPAGRSHFVVRHGERSILPFNKFGLTKQLLSPPGHSALEMLMLVIEPDGGSGPEPWTRNAEKSGYVVEGRFELTVGAEVQVLEAGDSFQFDARLPHSFRNRSSTTTSVVWVIKADTLA